MNRKMILVAMSSFVFLAPFAVTLANATLPDTDCSQFGVDYVAGVDRPSGSGPSSWANPPHVYVTAGTGNVVDSFDVCTNYAGLADPTLFSGEFGFGIGGNHLLSRAGPNGAGDGDGSVGCFGAFTATGAHHGPHTVIHVQDDVFQAAVGFSVTADWNRTTDNLGTGNQVGDQDCGDGLVEPCDPPTLVPPACNPLDQDITVLPAPGIVGGPVPPAGDNWLNIATGQARGDTIPATPPTFANWGAFVGADGAVPVFVFANFRADQCHAGVPTTGAIWTNDSNGPPRDVCLTTPLTNVPESCGYAHTSTELVNQEVKVGSVLCVAAHVDTVAPLVNARVCLAPPTPPPTWFPCDVDV